MLPYDKFKAFGPQSLTDEELLAIILRTGTDGEDAVTVACHVLKACGDRGLLGLYHVDIRELQKVRGIGKVKAVKLKAVAELAKRISGARMSKGVCLRKPADVASAYMEKMRHLEHEQCMVVFLDTRDCRLGDDIISEGSLCSTVISSREIFKKALKLNASSIIILHNHPSGDPKPSSRDMDVTYHLLEASSYMEIPLLDHIIIGDNEYYSFREKGDI